MAFSSSLPLKHHIARLATFLIDPGILLCLYANAHHLPTTLVTGYYASVGRALEAYSSRLVCVFVCVCNSVPPIFQRALKTKR